MTSWWSSTNAIEIFESLIIAKVIKDPAYMVKLFIDDAQVILNFEF